MASIVTSDEAFEEIEKEMKQKEKDEKEKKEKKKQKRKLPKKNGSLRRQPKMMHVPVPKTKKIKI